MDSIEVSESSWPVARHGLRMVARLVMRLVSGRRTQREAPREAPLVVPKDATFETKLDIRRASNSSYDERGSATSEFILIALPLFVPAILFFVSISQVSRAEMEASMLAREALNAFVSSENDSEAHQRTRLLLSQYSQLGAAGRETTSSTNSLSDQYSISCTAYPCIQPGAQVELTLFSFVEIESEISGIESAPGGAWGAGSNQIEKRRIAIASARGYVDKWS